MNEFPSDREIIEWVAGASPGVVLPHTWSINLIMEALERVGAPVYRGMAINGPELTAWAKEHLS